MAVSKKQMRWLTATACSAESLRIGDTNKLYSFLKKRQPNFLAISLSLSLSLSSTIYSVFHPICRHVLLRVFPISCNKQTLKFQKPYLYNLKIEWIKNSVQRGLLASTMTPHAQVPNQSCKSVLTVALKMHGLLQRPRPHTPYNVFSDIHVQSYF